MADTLSPLYEDVATRVMLALTGRRWTWPPKRVLEEYQVPEVVSSVVLVGRPVSAVLSVVDRAGNAYAWEESDSFRLRIPALEHRGWPPFIYPNYDAQGGRYPMFGAYGLFLRVDYIYGGKPPVDVLNAIDELAGELQAAHDGRDCKLPQRVTQVSREGVSWTVIDPQQFLEGGKTGLYYPDLVISTYGNKVRARAKVYSPEHRPPRRLSSQVLSASGSTPSSGIQAITSPDNSVEVGGTTADTTLEVGDISGTYDLADPSTVITYDGSGNLASVVEGGTTTTYTYNPDGSIATQTRLGVTRTYSYDASGNLTGIT